MQKVNILYVITKLELGGAQKQLLSLINHLDKKQFQPFLFTAKEGLLIPEVSSVPCLTVRKSICLERPINPVKDFFALIELCYFIKKNNIVIVHTHSSKAGILGRIAAYATGVKFIIHSVHGWSFNDYQPAWMRGVSIILERITGKFTHRLIVVSNYDKEKGLRNRIGCPDKYELIRYGVDFKECVFSPQDARKELGIDSDKLVVGTISCLKPQKSPQDFIKLVHLTRQGFPGVRFVLVGDGPLRKSIVKLINKFNLQEHVILTGWRRDIEKILKALDVFVLTSLWEGLPISVLEAMMASKPVVATNTGGIAEVIVDGKTGFLVKPGDVKGMSEKLAVLLRNKELREEIGTNAKNHLGSNFSLGRMLEGTCDCYNNLLIAKEASLCKPA